MADSAAGNHPATVAGSVTRGAATTLNDDSNAACGFTGGTATTASFFNATTGISIAWVARFNTTVIAANMISIGITGPAYVTARFKPPSGMMITWRATDNTFVDTEIPVTADWYC